MIRFILSYFLTRLVDSIQFLSVLRNSTCWMFSVRPNWRLDPRAFNLSVTIFKYKNECYKQLAEKVDEKIGLFV